MTPAFLKRNSDGEALGLVIACLLFPSVIWIFRDLSVWPWDQAYYGEMTLKIVHGGRDPIRWIAALVRTSPFRPPLLPWMAEFTLPFEGLLGSPERALLLTNVIASAVTLTFVFTAVHRLGGASTPAAIAAVLLCGGASLFIGLGPRFFVEPVQMMTIAGLLRFSWEADHWPWLRLLSTITIWMVLSMLAKTTSLAIVLPMLFYVLLVCIASWRTSREDSKRSDYFLAIIAGLLTSVGAAWYVKNWQAMILHVREATSSEIALYFGSVGPLSTKLHFWILGLSKAISPWGALSGGLTLIVITALGLAMARVARKPVRDLLPNAIGSGLVFALCIAGTIILVLFGSALQINEDLRLLAPMIPMLAILLGWSLSTLHKPWLTWSTVIILSANALAGHAHAQGMISLTGRIFSYVQPPEVQQFSKGRLMRAVRQSCDRNQVAHPTLFGTEFPDFGAQSASFYAEKQRLALGYRCRYISFIAWGFAETDVGRAIAHLYQSDVEFFVTLPLDQIPSVPNDPRVNSVARPAAEWIAASADFERLTGENDPIVIYRRRR